MNFSIEDISDIIGNRMQQAGVWQSNCPVSLERLKLACVSYIDFKGNLQSGQIIVLDKLATSTLNIFQELLSMKFPIHSISPMEKYLGDDNKSMSDNNSSAFNYRVINGTSNISMHGYGLAIDINPVQNPCIEIKDDKSVIVHPLGGADFLNRNNIRNGMVEPIVDIFKKNGFTQWGGNWNTPIDYHHFQVPRAQVSELIS